MCITSYSGVALSLFGGSGTLIVDNCSLTGCHSSILDRCATFCKEISTFIIHSGGAIYTDDISPGFFILTSEICGLSAQFSPAGGISGCSAKNDREGVCLKVSSSFLVHASIFTYSAFGTDLADSCWLPFGVFVRVSYWCWRERRGAVWTELRHSHTPSVVLPFLLLVLRSTASSSQPPSEQEATAAAMQATELR